MLVNTKSRNLSEGIKMTQDDIILMARKVAINGWHPERGEWFEFNHESLERFAALVAEATKEKAAKVCEEISEYGSVFVKPWEAVDRCAAAIRARNEK